MSTADNIDVPAIIMEKPAAHNHSAQHHNCHAAKEYARTVFLTIRPWLCQHTTVLSEARKSFAKEAERALSLDAV
jgi:hypothetical protein